MKFHKTFLLVLVLLALPITASAYTITWDNLTSNPDVLVTATGGDLETKTGDGGHTAVGISGGVGGEINQGEAMTFTFSSSQTIASLTLAFLYPNGQYDDTANEIATIKAVSDGVTYTYSLTATGWYTADWTGEGSVSNVAQAITGDDGMWTLTDLFGDLAVDSLMLTVLGTSTRCPSTCNNYDFAFYAMNTTNATPIPGAVWLLGAGLVGVFGYRKKIRG